MYTEEKTYRDLLAPLGEPPTVWAEVLFVDPISDLAIVGAPDNQVFYDQADAYDQLVDKLRPLPMADTPRRASAWMLALDGKWFRCMADPNPLGLWLSDAGQDIVGGMSGSPIIAEDGSAIGIMCVSSAVIGKGHREGGPNPRLACHLPMWLAPLVRRPRQKRSQE
jgi:hypothetical protein